MKKVKSMSDDLRREYRRSDFKGLERGKYYARVKATSNVVVLDPDVASVFRSPESVNSLLRSVINALPKNAKA
ncbi:MAG: hypothetical protein LAN62_18930 [Acidobacteriia bacterium]|nr:hypothetical protein [Terriglobia bacterium]